MPKTNHRSAVRNPSLPVPVNGAVAPAATAVTAPDAAIVTIKRRAPVEVEIDIDALTWEDMEQVSNLEDEYKKNGMDAVKGFIDLLNKICNVDVRTLPARATAQIMTTFFEEFNAMMDKKN